MNIEIIKKLQRLNKIRIQYIHNYLKGSFDYDSIKDENINFELTIKELENYCFETSVRIIGNAEDFDNTIGFVKPVKLKNR